MIMRMKYAKPWLVREEAEVDGQFRHKVTSKYMPHQGKQEMARRRRQMGVTFGQYAAQDVFTYSI
jgi:hypothetical protein